MKRKFIGLMCVLAITSSFVACGSEEKDETSAKTEVTEESSNDDESEEKEKEEEKEEEKKTVENPLEEYGVSIEIPSSWKVIDDEILKAGLANMWNINISTGATVGILVDGDLSEVSLSDYKAAMEMVLKDEGLEGTIEDKKYGEMDTFEVKVEKDQLGKTYVLTQVGFKAGDNFITVMLSEPKEAKTSIKDFVDSLNTLKEI